MEIDIGNVVIDEELNIGELQLDFIQIILRKPNQEKEVTPTKQEQNIFADTGYELEKVIVKPIPSEYIVPIGSVDIVENGIYNVKDKVTANVNIPEKQLGTKTITKNGIYKATDDNLDGYSEVEVETSGVDINDYFETNYTGGNYLNFIKKVPNNILIKGTSCYYMFANFQMLSEILNLDTSKVTNMYGMFNHCSSLTTIPQLDTSKVTSMSIMFGNCSSLTTIPQLDTSSVTNIQQMFNFNSKLTDMGGLKNLGMAYLTTQSANYYQYTLDLSFSPLTHDSLMNVINNLYDIKTKGCNVQSLVLGSTNLAKLTAEEIAIATNKGFSVS